MFCYKLKLIDALRSECLRAAHPTRYHVSAALRPNHDQ